MILIIFIIITIVLCFYLYLSSNSIEYFHDVCIEYSVKFNKFSMISDRKTYMYRKVKNKKDFIKLYCNNQKLIDWLNNSTPNYNKLDRVFIGNEGETQKIYYSIGNDNIYAYKVNGEQIEKCVYTNHKINYRYYSDILTPNEYNKFINIFSLSEKSDYVFVNHTTKNNQIYIKGCHAEIYHKNMKLNDISVINFIKVLDVYNTKLIDFIEKNSDMYVTYIGISKDREIILYYMDSKTYNNIRNSLHI